MPGPSDSNPTRTLPPLRDLRRSRDNKMIAGVAGGIAEFLNVDPLLVRVVLAALTPFGGVGALLYAAGWLLMPATGERMSIAESALKHGRTGGSFVEAVLLVIAVLALGSWMVSDHHDGVWLLVGTLVGAVLLYRHLDSRGVIGASRESDAATRVEPPATPAAGSSRPAQQSILSDPPNLVESSMDAVNREADRIAAEHLAAEHLATEHLATEHLAAQPQMMRPTRAAASPARRRSGLGLAVACVALIFFGLIAAISTATGDLLSIRHSIAIALAIVGVGVLVGARWGRARGLIGLGIPLTVLLIAAASMPLTWSGAVGRSTWRPATVAAIQPVYHTNAGLSRLDFTAVDFTGATVRTTAQTGAGKLHITVPPNVDVVLHATITAGEIDAFGQQHNGGDIDYRRTDYGLDGPGGGTLDLTVQSGFGMVEVDRAAA